MQLRHLAALLMLISLAAGNAWGQVVKNHTGSWVDDGTFIEHTYRGPGSSSNRGSSVMFEAEGGTLSTIGIIWGHGEGGVPNAGNPAEWDWKFSFWSSTSSYILDPWGESPEEPSYSHLFEAPSNPDWYTQVGSTGSFNLYYAEVDVSFLGIQLPSSGMVHAMLVPDARFSDTDGLFAFSDGVGAIGLYDDWFKNQVMGPDTLHNLGAPHDFGAAKVTVIPAAPVLSVFGTAGLVMNRRRRK